MNATNSCSKLSDSILWLDGRGINSSKLLSVLRRQGYISSLVRELVLENALETINLGPAEEERLLAEFRSMKNLEGRASYLEFLSHNHLDEALLRQSLSRPHKVVRYREERWGSHTSALYLKNKERYDRIIYRRLQTIDADVMQEVFFRLKDREDTWENIACQFPGARPNANARQGPVLAGDIEPRLLQALRHAGPGRVIQPLSLGSQIVVAELEKVETSYLNDELRTRILREEFDNWLESEYTKMLRKLRYL